MTTFIVGWDGYIDKFRRRISIAEGNDRDIDIGSFLDGLGVGARIGDDD